MNRDHEEIPESVRSTLEAMNKKHPSRVGAVEASWVCLMCSVTLPIVAALLVFSALLPGSRSGAALCIYFFAAAQLVAVMSGVLSLFGIRRETALGIIVRSGLGILLGSFGGFYIISLAGFAGIGP